MAERAYAQLERLRDQCAELRMLTKANDKETVFTMLKAKVTEAARASLTAVS